MSLCGWRRRKANTLATCLRWGSQGRPFSPSLSTNSPLAENLKRRGAARGSLAGRPVPAGAGPFLEESSGGGRMFGAQAAKAVIKPQRETEREREREREGGRLSAASASSSHCTLAHAHGRPAPLGLIAGAGHLRTPGSRRHGCLLGLGARAPPP